MKYLNHMLVVAAGLLIAGCATSASNAISGLPKGAQVVGGGMEIEWRAPESGTAILVEEKTRKVLKTAHVAPSLPGFRFNPTNSFDAQIVRAMFPALNTTNLEFVLYYLPDKKVATGKDQPGL